MGKRTSSYAKPNSLRTLFSVYWNIQQPIHPSEWCDFRLFINLIFNSEYYFLIDFNRLCTNCSCKISFNLRFVWNFNLSPCSASNLYEFIKCYWLHISHWSRWKWTFGWNVNAMNNAQSLHSHRLYRCKQSDFAFAVALNSFE